MNLSLGSYVTVKCEATGEKNVYLLDTGASISVLKINKLLDSILIDNFPCKISGIAEGLVSTYGSIKTRLLFGNNSLSQTFHVVSEDFPIPCDGILGLDFFKFYRCAIDYGCERTLKIRPTFCPLIRTELFDSPDNSSLTIPARCEVIRRVHIALGEGDVYVPSQQIYDGVFIGRTIMSRCEPCVRVVNTTDEDLALDNVTIVTEDLSNYNVIELPDNTDIERPEVMQKLQKNFPSQFSDDLNKLCSEYNDVFALDSDPVTFNNFYKQKLRLKDETPVFQRNYRIPHSQKPILQKLVQKYRKNGIISPSISEYNSPILLVPKKKLPGNPESRYRFVVDYRLLNTKLLADKFPLPRMDDILDRLGKARYFSKFDLLNGFHQIELEEESKDLTSFSTDEGSFKFNSIPFGLKIGPNSFQRMMTLAFSGLSPLHYFIYMDDLIITAKTEKEMFRNITEIFEVCRKYNLKLHPDKCEFFLAKVTFLGHKCTRHGILPDDSKIEKVMNYPTPTDADSAGRFIAFCNYYRRFILKFSHHAQYITHLTKKDVKFEWTKHCEIAFNYLKASLISPPILKYPDFDKKFCITTDASKLACGAVLTQEYDGIQMPVAYASKSFTSGERHKSTPEQELTAIHWALGHFKPYIYGHKFLLRTDHRPLIYLHSLKNPSSKLLRMRLDIEKYDFEIEHIQGKQNVVVDALSRIDYKDIKEITNKINVIYKVTTRSQTRKTDDNNNKSNTNVTYKDTKTNDLRVYEVMHPVEVKKLPRLIFNFATNHCTILLKKKILIKLNLLHFIVNRNLDLHHVFLRLENETNKLNVNKIQFSLNDELFEKFNILNVKAIANKTLKQLSIALTPSVEYVYDVDKQNELIKRFHDDPLHGGHIGIRRIYKKIRLNYFWRDMLKMINQYVKHCKQCQTNKTRPRTKEKLTITPTPQSAFDIVVVDTIGPLIRSDRGNVYAVTLICDLTKYLVTVAVPDKKAMQIAKAIFENFILIFGPMRQLLSDRGSEYVNSILDDLCKLLNVENKTSTSYHHRTLGTVERSHRTLNEYLRSYVNENKTDWDDWLVYFTYCYNTTPSVAINDYCPYQLIFGKTPNIYNFLNSNTIDPVYNIDDYHREVKFRLQIANQRAKQYLIKSKVKRKIVYDQKANPQSLSLDDLVLLEIEERHKLDPFFKGPFRIKEIFDPNVIITDDKGKEKLVHKDKVKLFEKAFFLDSYD